MIPDHDLVAHWTLSGDCRDRSGNDNHGTPHGVRWREGACLFDGSHGYVEVPDAPALHLGEGEFTIAARIQTEGLREATGDIVTKYDPVRRAGLNLCIHSFHGVTSSQPNYRNLFFGMDGGTQPLWTDRGRPGNAVMVWALCVHKRRLYAGTFEIGEDERGHVHRYEGGTEWTDCGAPHPSNAVTSLAVHDGELYAAASHYRSSGSALQDSENTTPGGRVFRYEGGKAWADCGKVGRSESIGGLATLSGRLYATSMYAPPALFRYEGGKTWTDCGNPGGRVESLGVYRGHLYGSGWDAERGGVYRYDGERRWTDCGTPPGNTQTYSFVVHRGLLLVGTWPSGRVFSMIRDGWEDCGRLGEEREVMGMLVFNGKLYAGTLPSANVYRHDGGSRWTRTGQLDTTPGARYRRVWSMAVYGGELFCGTLPSGRVRSLKAGECVTHDRGLGPGWRSVAAVRGKHDLRLAVDGQIVASKDLGHEPIDVTNSRPLMIGFGEHDYFRGLLRDVRVYSRALSDQEVAVLHPGG